MAKKSSRETKTNGNKAKLSNSDLAGALARVLANTYVLAVKTHGFHWNVTGPLFVQLHEDFSRQYTALFAAADEVAERIRAIGDFAPGGMAQFLELADVEESDAAPLTAQDMILELIEAHEKTAAQVQSALDLADDLDDDVTQDMMTQRLADHEKTLWMLRSQVMEEYEEEDDED